MPITTGNTLPLFPGVPQIGWSTLTTQNIATDGTGTVSTLVTATGDGTFIKSIRARALGTNVASVLRIFLNNGSSNAVAANNSLFHELTLPATTASATAALQDLELPMNLLLPNGYKINVTIGTTVVAGWSVTAIGGNC